MNIKPYDTVPGKNIYKILLFSENFDLLSELHFYTRKQNILVEVCLNARELVSRARRFGPDVLLVDEDTYLNSNEFSDAAKIIKAIHIVRVILLVKNLTDLSFDENVVDETRFLSRDVVSGLFSG